MRPQGGFTLLEVLLATSLVTVVATATLSWMTAQARSARALTQEAQALTTAQAVADAIRDDLLLAVPDQANKGQRYTLERQRLRLMTLNHMPGDEPGLRVVQWRQDAHLGALVREIIPADPKAKPIARIVSRDLRVLRFNTGEGTGILFLVYTMGSSTTEHALPVTRAGMP
jgi:prepilin-type N-terminal cleavage/methylation domain-containing protein